jgi:hypothetical protein
MFSFNSFAVWLRVQTFGRPVADDTFLVSRAVLGWAFCDFFIASLAALLLRFYTCSLSVISSIRI